MEGSKTIQKGHCLTRSVKLLLNFFGIELGRVLGQILQLDIHREVWKMDRLSDFLEGYSADYWAMNIEEFISKTNLQELIEN